MLEVLSIVAFRVSSIAAGAWIVYMGYRLFAIGLFEQAGTLKAAWGERNLQLKQAAPGTFFVSLGTLLLLSATLKGITYESVERGTPSSADIFELHGQRIPEDVVNTIFSLAIGEEVDQEARDRVLNWAYEKRVYIDAEHRELPGNSMNQS